MAAALQTDPPADHMRRVLAAGAAGTRNAIRQLRSLLFEIYPPSLRDHGLAAALPDLASQFAARGVEVDVRLPPDDGIDPDSEQLVYRVAQEALRNVAAHSAASHVTLSVERDDGLVRLRVDDDGRGFDPERVAQRRAGGHMGLSLLHDLAESAGGDLRIESAPGRGTSVELEVPLR
jgi:two-component system, NarL family, sensor kinase